MEMLKPLGLNFKLLFIQFIGFNLGRDNEPSIMPDGRIVFTRLEVFYSRLKTEQTLHAVYPDGTRDVVLYGPERREFWVGLDVGPRGDDYAAQTPAMHRVLRISQPQALPDGRVVVFSVLADGYRSGAEAALDGVDGFVTELVADGTPR